MFARNVRATYSAKLHQFRYKFNIAGSIVIRRSSKGRYAGESGSIATAHMNCFVSSLRSVLQRSYFILFFVSDYFFRRNGGGGGKKVLE